MRPCTRLALLVVPVLSTHALAQGSPACRTETGQDIRILECRLETTGAPQRLRFAARFSGSHDDTAASLDATLDGKPLDCDEGSKPVLEGEDGNVTLDCRVTIRDGPEAARILKATLVWRHAIYVDFNLVPN